MRSFSCLVPLLSTTLLAAAPAAAQSLNGRVVDAGTGAPVAGARLSLLDPDGRSVAAAVSDASGRFRLSAAAPGAYRLSGTALGYRFTLTRDLELAARAAMEVELRMVAEPVALSEVVVAVRRRSVLSERLDDFEGRRWRAVGGYFRGPAEIARMQPFTTTDALQGIPVVRIEGGGWSRGVTLPIRMQTLAAGGRCSPNFYVDGYPLRLHGASIDDLMTGTKIAAVEVYASPAGAPAEFPAIENPYCGVIVLWTGREL